MPPDYDKIAEQIPIGGNATAVTPDDEVEKLIAEGRKHVSLPVTDEKYQGLAEQKGYDQSNPKNRIQKVGYNHDAMIDIIIAEPSITQGEIAKRFGMREAWISRIIGSDAFQAALAKRRDDVTNPYLVATVEERLTGVVNQSLEIIAKKLEDSQSVDVAFKGLEIGVKALGYGARNLGNNQQTNFTIVLPQKSGSSAEWVEDHGIKKVGNG